MKRDHLYRDSLPAGGSYGGAGSSRNNNGNLRIDDVGVGGGSSSSSLSGKAKLWEEQDPTGGMDELLAVLGYKVRSSDMADVAQKLEQLEMVMGTAAGDGDSIPSLSETVHYNPSDLFGWVQSMLSELNTVPDPPSGLLGDDDATTQIVDFGNHAQIVDPQSQSRVIFNDDSEYDLRAIPGVAAFRPRPEDRDGGHKRLRTSIEQNPGTAVLGCSPPPCVAGESGRPVVVVDSQEAGVRLVHTLMACAEAVQQDNLKVADALVKHVGLLAASQAGAMRKVATYFAEALARRIYRIYPQDCLDSDLLQMHFYESCPYLKFAHFTANQAILEAFATATRVHVVDFGLNQGMQWPALMQALALRPGGPPAFRLTGIGPPRPDNTDALQQVGWKLAQLADSIGVEFEFRGFVATSLADLEPAMLEVRPDMEVVAVNSVFELHRLLARPGAIDKVLGSIKAMKPKIVTVVEEEANHNGPVFLDRFNEALHYYSNLFDSLEGSGAASGAGANQDLVMSEVYLGRQICNVVACEGADRVERHETLAQWQARFRKAGFDPVHLGSNAFKQASMLCGLYAGGDGYKVDESGGCLMLGWHTRPLITTSAWQVAATD